MEFGWFIMAVAGSCIPDVEKSRLCYGKGLRYPL